MPSKKVFSNGFFFYLAHHKVHGLILFDETDQLDVPGDMFRVFESCSGNRILLTKESLKSETTDAVKEADAVGIINKYNQAKIDLGKLVKAKGYDAHTTLATRRHAQFLAKRGLINQGIREASASKSRASNCWSCTRYLNNEIDFECNVCGWIVCGHCGACGCGR